MNTSQVFNVLNRHSRYDYFYASYGQNVSESSRGLKYSKRCFNGYKVIELMSKNEGVCHLGFPFTKDWRMYSFDDISHMQFSFWMMQTRKNSLNLKIGFREKLSKKISIEIVDCHQWKKVSIPMEEFRYHNGACNNFHFSSEQPLNGKIFLSQMVLESPSLPF